MFFNDISLTRYDIRRCRMIYLLCKYDIISVPSYAEGIYHRSQSDIISKIYHPFRKERISLKKTLSFDKVFFMGWVMGFEPTNTGTTIRGLRPLGDTHHILFWYARRDGNHFQPGWLMVRQEGLVCIFAFGKNKCFARSSPREQRSSASH